MLGRRGPGVIADSGRGLGRACQDLRAWRPEVVGHRARPGDDTVSKATLSLSP